MISCLGSAAAAWRPGRGDLRPLPAKRPKLGIGGHRLTTCSRSTLDRPARDAWSYRLTGDRDGNGRGTGNRTRFADFGRSTDACQTIGAATAREFGFSAHRALSRKTAQQHLAGTKFDSPEHSRTEPQQDWGQPMIGRHTVEDYRRMNSEDRTTFRRWLALNTVIGIAVLFAMIAINGMFWGGERSTNSSKYSEASQRVGSEQWAAAGAYPMTGSTPAMEHVASNHPTTRPTRSRGGELPRGERSWQDLSPVAVIWLLKGTMVP